MSARDSNSVNTAKVSDRIAAALQDTRSPELELTIALIVFLASAAGVVYFGTRLAIYGHALASLTGWGHVFVGSLLVALATSLPELSTNISAVRLDPPNPELAVGTVLGANMYNMFKLSIVILIFGGIRFIQRVAPEQSYLMVLSIIITAAALIFGAVKMDLSFWQIGLSSLILVVLFVVSMWVIYVTRPEEIDTGDQDAQEMTLRRAWVLFGVVSAAVVVAGFFLAWSADQIAEEAGVASSTLGILAVSFVTSLPELSMAIAAARIGAPDLAVAGLYGSNVFNISILFYADLFYRDGILVDQTVPSHFIAGGVAIGLMLAGLVLIRRRNRFKAMAANAVLVVMIAVTIAGAIVVATLGTTEGDDDGPGATGRSPGNHPTQRIPKDA